MLSNPQTKKLPKDVGTKVAEMFLNTGTPFEFSSTGTHVIIKYNPNDELLLRHAINKTGYRGPYDPWDR